jgi:PAS domain S-box-containing protein
MAAFPRLTSNPVLELAPDGAVLHANDAAVRMAESLGCASAAGLLPGDVAEIAAGLRAGLSGGDMAVEREVGGRTLRLLFFPIEETGTLHCYVGDVTGRRHAEEAMRESEEQFRTLVGNIPGAVFRCLCDEDYTMVYLSPAFERVTGYEPVEFLGNAIRSYASIIHPDDLAVVADAVRQGAESGPAYAVEYRIVDAGGGVRWVLEHGCVTHGPDGSPVSIDGAIFDVTDAKRAEQGLRRTTALVLTLLESLHSGILVQESDGRVALANQVLCRDFALGPDRDVLIGLDGAGVTALIAALVADGERFAGRVGEILDEHEAIEAEELELVDGRVFERDYVPVVVGDDERDGHLWQYRDVTTRKQVERGLEAQNEALKELDRMKDEFVATVTHELRTPLTSIVGYLHLLRSEPERLDDEQRRYLDIVERNAERLLRLVGDLLFLARMDAGRLTLELGDTDVAQVAADSVQASRPTDGKRVAIALDAGPVPTIRGDQARLGQLLDNLVSNAVKFTLEGGHVRVALRAAADRVVVTVSDSGIGIPEDEHARLFERFYRASTATSRRIQGTGLGLTITRAIVEGHGGLIRFTSREGAGTTFTVELPIAGPEAPLTAPLQPAGHAKAA